MNLEAIELEYSTSQLLNYGISFLHKVFHIRNYSWASPVNAP